MVVVCLAVLLLVVGGSAAHAEEDDQTDRYLADVTIMPTARIVDRGTAVVFTMRYRCEPQPDEGSPLWRNYMNVYQGDVFGHTEEWAMRCDRRWHHMKVRIPVWTPAGAVLTPGEARLSVYIQNDNTLVNHGMDIRTVTLLAAHSRPCSPHHR